MPSYLFNFPVVVIDVGLVFNWQSYQLRSAVDVGLVFNWQSYQLSSVLMCTVKLPLVVIYKLPGVQQFSKKKINAPLHFHDASAASLCHDRWHDLCIYVAVSLCFPKTSRSFVCLPKTIILFLFPKASRSFLFP